MLALLNLMANLDLLGNFVYFSASHPGLFPHMEKARTRTRRQNFFASHIHIARTKTLALSVLAHL
jgi:hypothetical protein